MALEVRKQPHPGFKYLHLCLGIVVTLRSVKFSETGASEKPSIFYDQGAILGVTEFGNELLEQLRLHT